MTNQFRFALLAAAAVILVGGVIIYRYDGGRSGEAVVSSSPVIGTQEPAAQELSAAYLMAHPAALKAAEKACNNGAGTDVVRLCDRVHSAEAGLMAEKYRNGANAATPPPH